MGINKGANKENQVSESKDQNQAVSSLMQEES